MDGDGKRKSILCTGSFWKELFPPPHKINFICVHTSSENACKRFFFTDALAQQRKRIYTAHVIPEQNHDSRLLLRTCLCLRLGCSGRPTSRLAEPDRLTPDCARPGEERADWLSCEQPCVRGGKITPFGNAPAFQVAFACSTVTSRVVFSRKYSH